MSSLSLPKHWRYNWPLLMAHLGKSASGHLIRTTGSPRHLAKCNPCPECTDYSRTWELTIASVVSNERNAGNCDGGNSPDSAHRKWGYVATPDLTSIVNATHNISVGSLGSSGLFPGTAIPCKYASGSTTVDVDGTLYMSEIVVNSDPRPGSFTGYGFTATLQIGLAIYDGCGIRMSSVVIVPTALSYDDSVATLYYTGDAVPLYMDYAERVGCGSLPLGGDDVWYNSGSFFGSIVQGYKNSEPTYKVQSRFMATLAMTGSSGTYASAVPA